MGLEAEHVRQGACEARSLLGLGVTGTCLYAIQSGEHVSKLRNDITSPGGTTGRVSIFKEYFDVCHGF